METSVQPQQPTRQQIAAQGRTAPGKVTGKLRRALDAMVWLGLQRAAAAKHAGLAEHSLYQALRRPPVKAYYLEQCEALRLSLRARGIHCMGEVQEQRDNLTAAVSAYKALKDDGASDVLSARTGTTQTPGFVVVIHQPPAAPAALTPQQRALDGNVNDINEVGSGQLERPTDATCRER